LDLLETCISGANSWSALAERETVARAADILAAAVKIYPTSG
jgi:hypothetical protein